MTLNHFFYIFWIPWLTSILQQHTCSYNFRASLFIVKFWVALFAMLFCQISFASLLYPLEILVWAFTARSISSKIISSCREERLIRHTCKKSFTVRGFQDETFPLARAAVTGKTYLLFVLCPLRMITGFLSLIELETTAGIAAQYTII